MWRTNGEGEFYTYLPSDDNPGFEANKNLCDTPNSFCNPTYGASVGRGAFDFKSGQWNTVSQRVRLNDIGQSNGELELFFNGKSVISVSGLKFRESAEGRFRGLQCQTFFGGKYPAFLCSAIYISRLVQVRSPNLLPQNLRILGSRTSPSLSPRPSERLKRFAIYDNIRQHTLSSSACAIWRTCPNTRTHYDPPYRFLVSYSLSLFPTSDPMILTSLFFPERDAPRPIQMPALEVLGL